MAAQVPLPPLLSLQLPSSHAAVVCAVALFALARAYRPRRRVRGERRSGFRTHRWHSPATGTFGLVLVAVRIFAKALCLLSGVRVRAQASHALLL